MITAITVYEVADGSRFDSLEAAEEYDSRMLYHEAIIDDVVPHDFQIGDLLYSGGWNVPMTFVSERICYEWRWIGALGKKVKVKYNVLHCVYEAEKQISEVDSYNIARLRKTPYPQPRTESD